MLYLAQLSMATPNPMVTTCADAKAYFRTNECCSATMGKEISTSTTICPTLDELVTYPLKMGNVRRRAICCARSSMR